MLADAIWLQIASLFTIDYELQSFFCNGFDCANLAIVLTAS
jgi:hypothetical protein